LLEAWPMKRSLSVQITLLSIMTPFVGVALLIFDF